MHFPGYSELGGDPAVTDVALELDEGPCEGARDSSPYIHIPGAYYKTAQGDLLQRYQWDSPPAHGRDTVQTMVQAKVLGVPEDAAAIRERSGA